MVKIFDNFWEPDSPFSKLTVNCLLIIYFVYCNNCDLKNVSEGCFYICSIIALCLPKMYLWPAETKKNIKLLEMHTCLWTGAQMWFRHQWKKLVTASFLLHCTEKLWLPLLLEWVIFSCVSGFRLNFSRLSLQRKRLQLDSKSVLTTNGLILGFFVGKWLPSSTSYLHGLNIAWISQLLFFWRHHFFSMFSLRGILGCSLKTLVLFSDRIFLSVYKL